MITTLINELNQLRKGYVIGGSIFFYCCESELVKKDLVHQQGEDLILILKFTSCT